MYGPTKAFLGYKKLTQAHMDFILLVCYAVPSLKEDLKKPGPSISVLPDHFKPKTSTSTNQSTSKERLSEHATIYQEELARSAHITIFSYFENYFKSILQEIVDFHGGIEEMKTVAFRRSSRFVSSISPQMRVMKRKLQEPLDKGKYGQYEKYTRLLEKEGFHFPTELFAYFGIAQLIPKLYDKGKDLRAFEIPSILRDCLLFPISDTQSTRFEAARVLRNNIGHGKTADATLEDSLGTAKFFHAFAAKIDMHAREHFFIVQRFT